MKMTKDEIIERLADFALLSDIPGFIELRDAARELLKPEPDYKKWEGALVYVKNRNQPLWHGPYILYDYCETPDELYPFNADGSFWQQCAPYDGKVKLIPIIHDGSDKCPVDPQERILAKYVHADNPIYLRGEDHTWPQVESYMRVKI